MSVCVCVCVVKVQHRSYSCILGEHFLYDILIENIQVQPSEL